MKRGFAMNVYKFWNDEVKGFQDAGAKVHIQGFT